MIEKFEQVIFPFGDFKIKFVVNFGTKTTNGNRLDAVYEKTYNSVKYNGISELTTFTFNPNIYLVFSCFNKEEKNSEEVYLSFPQLTQFKNYLNNSIENLISNNVYNNKGINKEFSDLVLESNTLISNKKIFIVPQKIQNEDFYEDGIILFCNDENHCVEMNLNNLISIYEFFDSIRPIDLHIMAQNAKLLVSNKSSSYQQQNNSNSNSSATNNFRGRNINLNSSSKNSKPTGFINRRNIQKPEENMEEKINDEIDNIVEDEPVVKAKSSSLRRRGISLNDIKKTAEEIDDSEIDSRKSMSLSLDENNKDEEINIEDDIKFD